MTGFPGTRQARSPSEREAAALDAIITTLDARPETAAHGQPSAIRGAGVPARTDTAIARQEGRHAR